MANLERKRIGDRTNYVLDGKAIANGDELEMRMRGNKGWKSVEIAGLPKLLKVKFQVADGTVLHATIDETADLRWP